MQYNKLVCKYSDYTSGCVITRCDGGDGGWWYEGKAVKYKELELLYKLVNKLGVKGVIFLTVCWGIRDFEKKIVI